jgi:hypothetical protein
MRRERLYEGLIRGLVTGEPIVSYRGSYGRFDGIYFVIELEERIGEVPDEILVRCSKFGYFKPGDKVVLKGVIYKEYLGRWDRPRYLVIANSFYNESIKFGD